MPSLHQPYRRHRLRLLVTSWCILCGLATLQTPALAQSISPPPAYSFDIWQSDKGLPQNSITTIVQTRDGYLWLGSYNGLVRFDGIQFTVFDSQNTPQLTSSRVTSLFDDREGTLWIGHENGDLSQYREGVFSHVTLGAGWPGGQVIAIADDSHGEMWLLNDSGWLYSLKGASVFANSMNSDGGPSVPSLGKTRDGRLWVLRGGLLGVLEGGQIKPWTDDGGPDNYNYARACPSERGDLCLAGTTRVKHLAGRSVTQVSDHVPWTNNSLTALLETKSGDLLVGTLESGLFLVSSNGESRHFTRQNGLSSDWVRCLCEDREGNIWVGTGGGGLAALRTRTVEMVKEPDDWQGRAVLTVSPASAGGVWVGTEGAGLYHLFNGQEERFGPAEGILNTFVWSAFEDRDHHLWVGTWGKGLFRGQDGKFQWPPGFENSTAAVVAIFQDRAGVLWLGTQNGLGRYENGVCRWFMRADGLAVPDVRTIAQDASGAIWFGMSGGGLGCIRDGKLATFHRKDGLPSEFVESLFADDDGSLWIGTFGDGMCRLKNEHFATVSILEGLPNNVICQMADDGRGNLWVSSYGGIFRVRKTDLRRCADRELKSVYCFSYGKADGLATLECSGGSQPSGCRTPDGRLWFSTIKGLAVVDPARVRLNPVPPPVVIENITVDTEPILPPRSRNAAPPPLLIQPGRQRFTFHYTALSLVAPEKLRFKCRLVGLDPDWLEAGSMRTAYYSYLKPGDYTFRVIACNNDGVWNDVGASLAIRVLPHFWQTWSFSVAEALAGAGCAAGLARYLTRRKMRLKMDRLERQRALEKERARIAKDIHDDLGASLTRITLLSQSSRSELENPQQAAADLDQIYVTARQLTRAMDEIVWAVDPGQDTLDSLATYLGKFAQDFLSVAGIRCRLNVPLDLPAWPLTAEVRHSLFLAFKEALNNVLKHASATEVRISLVLAEAGFTLVLEDNGRGFHHGPGMEKLPDGPERLSHGHGLANMKKRLEEIGGTFVLHSSPGEGSSIKFVVFVDHA